MKMNYVDALNVAIATMTAAEQDETVEKAIEKLVTMRSTLQKRAETAKTPKNKEKLDVLNAKRKEANAKARAEIVATVAPILRKHLTKDITAKELYEAAKGELPADYSWNKVQAMLTRELKPEVIRTERKKGGDLYRLA
jgi:hypothetical protein